MTIGHGDAMDPLAGVVRIVRDPEQVDVIVGRFEFEQAILERSREFAIGDERIRVPTAPDLVLWKLAAGGPQDRSSIIEELDQRTDSLAGDAARLWQRIRQEWI